MPDHKQIYLEEAEKYQRLIAREDYQENIRSVLEEIISWDGLDVVDLGAGTGRLAYIIASSARSVIALDLSVNMLGVANDRFGLLGCSSCHAAAGDHRAIPLPAGSVDLVVSGWSFCYLAVWEEGDWRESLRKGLSEVRRVLRPGGTIVIFETLGTGGEEPERPDKLEGYFQYLETSGFQHRWLRTDYLFKNENEAFDLTEFFFGKEMIDAIRSDPAPILPECTGVWWKQEDPRQVRRSTGIDY